MDLWIMSIPLFSLAKLRSSPGSYDPRGQAVSENRQRAGYEQFTPTIFVGQSAMLAANIVASQFHLLSAGMNSFGG